MKKVEVTLHSETGSRVAEVQPKGFSARHVKVRVAPETEPLTLTPNPTPETTPVFTESTLIDIIEKMTALQNEDAPLCEGWHCEDSIYKVACINLKHNVTSRVLRQMLSNLTNRGVLEHKAEYGLNKFRLALQPKVETSNLQALLVKVDAIMEVQ